MKRLFVAVITLALSCAAAGQAASKASVSKDVAVEQALQQRFQEYADALTKRDLPTLDRIWAAEYTFINPNGDVMTKAQRMENIRSGATQFQSINPKQEHLQVRGNIAVDVGTVELKGTQYSGKESSGTYRYMNVWMKSGNDWQMLANQITLVKK